MLGRMKVLAADGARAHVRRHALSVRPTRGLHTSVHVTEVDVPFPCGEVLAVAWDLAFVQCDLGVPSIVRVLKPRPFWDVPQGARRRCMALVTAVAALAHLILGCSVSPRSRGLLPGQIIGTALGPLQSEFEKTVLPSRESPAEPFFPGGGTAPPADAVVPGVDTRSLSRTPSQRPTWSRGSEPAHRSALLARTAVRALRPPPREGRGYAPRALAQLSLSSTPGPRAPTGGSGTRAVPAVSRSRPSYAWS